MNPPVPLAAKEKSTVSMPLAVTLKMVPQPMRHPGEPPSFVVPWKASAPPQTEPAWGYDPSLDVSRPTIFAIRAAPRLGCAVEVDIRFSFLPGGVAFLGLRGRTRIIGEPGPPSSKRHLDAATGCLFAEGLIIPGLLGGVSVCFLPGLRNKSF